MTKKVRQVLDSLNVEKKEVYLTAAVLHDIGYYSDKITNFYPVDGFLFVKDNFRRDVALAVLHHSFAEVEANNLRPQLSTWFRRNKFTIASRPIWVIISYADLHIDSCGNDVGVDSRYQDIMLRHGETSEVYQHMLSIRSEVDELVGKIGIRKTLLLIIN